MRSGKVIGLPFGVLFGAPLARFVSALVADFVMPVVALFLPAVTGERAASFPESRRCEGRRRAEVRRLPRGSDRLSPRRLRVVLDRVQARSGHEAARRCERKAPRDDEALQILPRDGTDRGYALPRVHVESRRAGRLIEGSICNGSAIGRRLGDPPDRAVRGEYPRGSARRSSRCSAPLGSFWRGSHSLRSADA